MDFQISDLCHELHFLISLKENWSDLRDQTLCNILICYAFVGFVPPVVSLRLVPLQIGSRISACPLENISPNGSSCTADGICRLRDSPLLADRRNHASEYQSMKMIGSEYQLDLTPNFTALRRKNALHGAQVGIPKLIPTALSPHTKHWPSNREAIVRF